MTESEETLLKLARARFPDLKAPEETLVRAAASGEPADFTDQDEKPPVRAEVVAWLAADRAATEHVHRKGVQLHGAKIEGPLDLAFADLPHPLLLMSCEATQEINLQHARARFINLGGTQTGPIRADGLHVEGDLFLREGFHAKGEVSLRGAEIDGALDCDGGRFENPTGVALNADGVRVSAYFCLRNNFEAQGEVWLLGAEVGRNLECDGGRFENPGGNALVADGARVRGDIFLRNKFAAEGEVRLLGVKVDGLLDCTDGSFKNPKGDALSADSARVRGSVSLRNGFAAEGEVRFFGAEVGGNLSCVGGAFENRGADALDIDGAKVTGTLALHRLVSQPTGRVILRSATVGELADDPESWPNAGALVLDGFTYDHLAREAPHSAKERLEWIGLQAPENFSIQPYEHLATVFRRMGLEHEARLVAIAKQRALRARLPRWRKPWSYFLDATIGYGYRPWRAVALLLGVLAAGLIVFWDASLQNALCASQAPLFGGTGCHEVPPEYPEFSALFYALDVTMPFFDLQQERYWAINPTHPNAWFYQLWGPINIALGWLFSILAAVGFSGVLRKD